MSSFFYRCNTYWIFPVLIPKYIVAGTKKLLLKTNWPLSRFRKFEKPVPKPVAFSLSI